MSHVDEGTLHAYLDGELDGIQPGGAATLEAHLAGCDACRARLEEERRVRDRARQVLDHAAPADLDVPPFDAVLDRARGARGPAGGGAPARRRPFTIPLAWAASIALALAGGWWAREMAFQGRPGIADETSLGADADELQPLDLGPVAAPEGVVGQAPAAAPPARAARREAPPAPSPVAEDAGRTPAMAAAAPPAARVDSARLAAAAADALRNRRDEVARAAADSAEARRELAARVIEELPRAEAAAAFAPAEKPESWSPASRAEAERLLGGRLLLVEGLAVSSIEVADSAGVTRVRTRQALAPGVSLELLQRRAPPPAVELNQLVVQAIVVQADTAAAGGRREPIPAELVVVRDGFELLLRAPVAPDSLRALSGRLR